MWYWMTTQAVATTIVAVVVNNVTEYQLSCNKQCDNSKYMYHCSCFQLLAIWNES